jgi:hypothetical protein
MFAVVGYNGMPAYGNDADAEARSLATHTYPSRGTGKRSRQRRPDTA